jgi:hypothetical protein
MGTKVPVNYPGNMSLSRQSFRVSLPCYSLGAFQNPERFMIMATGGGHLGSN